MIASRVRALLEDQEPEVRRRATQEIPSLPAPESCDLLLLALADEDWRVRKEATAVAPRIEPRTAVVFAVARALGERDNVGLRNAAVEALVQIGPDAVPGAVDALTRLDADGRKLAVEVLAGAPTLAGMKTTAKAAKDEDPNVVVACAEALGKADLAGDEARALAIQTLETLLARDDVAVRVAALASLGALEAAVPWSRLEPLLGEPLLRRSALAAAAGDVTPRALLALAGAVADPHTTVARDALVSLGRSLEEAWDDEAVLDVAVKTLRASRSAHERLRAAARETGDAEARGAAILALGLVRDPDDVAVIADALADDEIADRAEAALQLFGQDAALPLIAAGKTAAPSLRGATISMLPVLGSQASEPLAAVREALEDPSAEVVAPALKSIAIVGVAADLLAVARHVRSADARVASAAQGALLAIAGREPDAARAMVPEVDPHGDDALAGAIVLEALGRVRLTVGSDLDFLESALTHREAATRRAAIDALAAIGAAVDAPASRTTASGSPLSSASQLPDARGPKTVAEQWRDDAARAVTVALADEEAVVALAAIRALGRLGRSEQLASLAATTKDPTRLAMVLRALRDADPERALAAARPLLRSPEPSIAAGAIAALEGRVEALLGATDHPDHEVVKLALGAIAKIGDERALAALATAIDHPSESVRKHAAELLGQTGADGEAVLRVRLDRERSAEVRRAIMEALAVRS
ncbi:MAG: HEAT repeat domain-containing protein [Labilithrix sp.]|nr:HEAT repeat domain-containing protein [Labilithrix sp.]MCW5811900.1 HEAT repeat domain-containing protein [Labilithrix sp.]